MPKGSAQGAAVLAMKSEVPMAIEDWNSAGICRLGGSQGRRGPYEHPPELRSIVRMITWMAMVGSRDHRLLTTVTHEIIHK